MNKHQVCVCASALKHVIDFYHRGMYSERLVSLCVLFLCPEIDFADLVFSLWNVLGICVSVCVCFAARTVYHMHIHTAGHGHLGLFSAKTGREVRG